METQQLSAISGNEIFFKFIEVDYNDPALDPFLVSKIHTGALDGVVTRNVMSQEEVQQILKAMAMIPEEEKLHTRTGATFPHPFATITDDNERLDNYINRLETFNKLPFRIITERLNEFFNKIGKPFDVGVPRVLRSGKEVSPGNFRIFQPDYGGLYLHCGYLFQAQSPFYYSVVDPMAKEGQLSYFLVLQYPEAGGELSIYDMLWKDVKRKDNESENEYAIADTGERIYVKNVRQFSVKPEPGSILVFSGGPIWHRVEDIKGTRPRITFGGFINFTPDDKRFYYWS